LTYFQLLKITEAVNKGGLALAVRARYRHGWILAWPSKLLVKSEAHRTQEQGQYKKSRRRRKVKEGGVLRSECSRR
jgi:hypothetical protein